MVGADELLEEVDILSAIVVLDRDLICFDLGDDATLRCGDDIASIDSSAVFHAGSDIRSLSADQWNCLTHHVRTHQRAVRIIMLEERDHRGRDRDHLARRDVHVIDFFCVDVLDFATTTTYQDLRLCEVIVIGQWSVRLSDDVLILLISGQVIDLIGDLALDYFAIWSLDETEWCETTVGRERTDESDVRTFRRFDRTHTSIVRWMHVTDFEASAITRETARSERRETSLMCKTREWIGLIHELRELGCSEELLDRCSHWTDVDQGLRRDRLDILCRHTFLDHALHTRETGSDLVLDQLTDATKAAVSEVVDIVDLDTDLTASLVHLTAVVHEGVATVECCEISDRRDDVLDSEEILRQFVLDTELLVDLVAADLRKVIALRIEIEILDELESGFLRWRLTRTHLAIDIEECVVLIVDGVLLKSSHDGWEVTELTANLIITPTKRLQEDGDGLLTLTIDTDACEILLVDLELEPSTTAWDDLGSQYILIG